MGIPEAEEHFRCRVYGDEETPEDRQRAAFVERLAGDGVLECPAHGPWIVALQGRGWLPEDPGRVKRWRLTAKGRAEWAHMKG